MSDFLSNEWINKLEQAWNHNQEMVDALSKVSFTASIGYGFIKEKKPRCYISVINGKIIQAGIYNNQDLDWDLRAEPKNWQRWLKDEGFGLKNLGPAVALGRLKFVKGNYREMIRNPKLAIPFLNHFDLMGDITTNFDIIEKKKGFGFFDLFKR